MKIFFATFSILLCLFFISCQKEADFSNGNNGGNGGSNGGNSGGLLKKIVSKSGSDSSVLSFDFNSSQKLITLSSTIVSNGSSAFFEQKVVRNSLGIIQKVIIKSDVYQQSGLDSVITNIQYSGGKYISKVTNFDFIVLVAKDSVTLAYDGSGKIITEREFFDLGTGSYEEMAKREYTYSGNNIASIKSYAYDAGTSSYSLEQTYTYDQYDSKISPMSIGIDAFVFGSAPLYSANNPTKSSISSPSSGTYNYTTTYTYNSSNKPINATSVIQPGNSTSSGTYYYQ